MDWPPLPPPTTAHRGFPEFDDLGIPLKERKVHTIERGYSALKDF